MYGPQSTEHITDKVHKHAHTRSTEKTFPIAGKKKQVIKMVCYTVIEAFLVHNTGSKSSFSRPSQTV